MWKICIEDPFLNCHLIYPIQQKKVKAMIDGILSKYGNTVSRIIVFGSSVTNRCHIGSDVDLFVETEEKHLSLPAAVSFAYDLWSSSMADDRIRNEIYKTGVIVYDKNAT